MKCINCGNELPDGSRFCNVCGTDQSVETEVKPAQGVESNPDLIKGEPDHEVIENSTIKPVPDKKGKALNQQAKIILGLCSVGLLLFLAF